MLGPDRTMSETDELLDAVFENFNRGFDEEIVDWSGDWGILEKEESQSTIIALPNPAVEPEEMQEAARERAFAYGLLESEVADAAQAAAVRIRTKCRTGQTIMFEIGRELLNLKCRLPHGAFSDWIEAEFGWSNRTALNYMQAARLYAENATVADLPPKLIYELRGNSSRPVFVSKLLGVRWTRLLRRSISCVRAVDWLALRGQRMNSLRASGPLKSSDVMRKPSLPC
jgi:hypothetical protein